MRPISIVVLVAIAFAEDAPQRPEMDEISRKTLDAWHDKEYHLGRAGVKRARCAVEVSLPPLPEDPKRPRTTKGVVLWDGEKASTRWEDEDLGHEADFGDLAVKDWIATLFEPWWKQRPFEGAKLRGVRNGKRVTVEVTRDETTYTVAFDAEGVLAGVEWRDGDRTTTETLAYEAKEKKLLLKSSEAVVREPGMTCSYKAEIHYDTTAGYWVPARVGVKVVTSRGADAEEEASEVRLTDWKLNEDAK